jgi:plastocyanin
MRFLPTILAALAAVALSSGCGSSHPDAAATAAAQAMLSPRIVPNTHGTFPDSFYRPNPIRVKVGQTITWTNLDGDPHDVTADSGMFYSGPMAYHGFFRWKAVRAGRYTYFCTLHPEMKGVIIVRA